MLVGSQILAPLVHLKDVITFVRSHHERWDGFGYPDRLAGEAIPLGARIIGAVEIYDALTTARPYQEKMPPDMAVERMRDLIGSARPGHSRGAGGRGLPPPGARLPGRRPRLSVPVPAAQGRILLVDDDPMIVRLVKQILAAKGLGEVVHATSGREALERLDDNGVAVVLLDHQLPDGTGLDVLDAIRARPHPPAVVMITAHGNESLAAAALRRGADDYLAKDASLAEMLPQILERVRRARELPLCRLRFDDVLLGPGRRHPW